MQLISQKQDQKNQQHPQTPNDLMEYMSQDDIQNYQQSS